jgi:hypothetical protein
MLTVSLPNEELTSRLVAIAASQHCAVDALIAKVLSAYADTQAGPNLAAPAPAAVAPLAGPVAKILRFSEHIAGLPSIKKLNPLMLETLAGMGLEMTASESLEGIAEPDLCAWSCLALREQDKWTAWFDFYLSLDKASCQQLYRLMAGEEPKEESQFKDLLLETLNLLQGAIKCALEADKVAVMMPFLPMVVRRSDGVTRATGDGVSYLQRFTTDGIDLVVSLLESRANAMATSPIQLHPLDVLTSVVYANEDNTVPLLKEGTALNEKYINKLQNVFRDRINPVSISVVRPPDWTQFYLNKAVSPG